MHVYRNRRYEEEIVMLIWHMKGEQRMVETHKQKTRIQAHHKITDSATQTHRGTHRNKQKTTCTGYDTRGDRPPGRTRLVKGFLPRSQTTNVGIPSFVLSGTKRAAAALAMAAAICTRKREKREPRSLVKVS
jgi:hypothetical protein